MNKVWLSVLILFTASLSGCGGADENTVIERDAEMEAQIAADEEAFSRQMEASDGT